MRNPETRHTIFSPKILLTHTKHALILLLTLLAFLLGYPTPAQAAATASITLTSQETLWLDANKCNSQGPRGAWLSFLIENTGTTTLTDVTVTFAGFTGTNAAYFKPPTDLIRTFSSLAIGEKTPVYYYIDYAEVCNHPQGGGSPYDGYTANYALTVSSPTLTTSIVRSGTVVTDELLTANAGGIALTSVLGPGVYVGQILVQTVTYDIGNNTDLFFQPAGEAAFQDSCLRLVGSEITAVSGSVSTALIGMKDRLHFPTASVPAGGGTITVTYAWDVRCVNTTQTVHPWTAAKSGQKYKYTGFAASTIIPAGQQGITLQKSVTPNFLADNTLGPVTYSVLFTNNSPVGLILTSISDQLPACMSVTDPAASGSQVTAANSSSMPSSGATGLLKWIGKSHGKSPNTTHQIAANSTLLLKYTANVSNCPVPSTQINSVTGQVGSTTIGPATAALNIGIVEQAPNLTVIKENNANNDATFSDTETYPGTTPSTFPTNVTYQVKITNNSTSAATITAIGDAPHDISGSTCADLLNTTIAAGETKTCTFSAPFVNADQTPVINTFSVTAANNTGTDIQSDTSTVNFVQTPTLTVQKDGTLDLGTDGVATPGDLINYIITVGNNGNQTLTGVSVSDSKVASLTCNPTIPALLPLGASLVCTGSYALTQVDIDAGLVDNTATADSNQTIPVSAVNQEAVPQTPDLDITKEGTLVVGGDGVATPGDLINYTIIASNNGNQTLTNVTINDSKVASLTCIPTTPATLAPGTSMICTGSYALTQADIDAGVVNNTATADSNQTDPPVTDSVTKIIPQAPSLGLTKEGTLAVGTDGIATPGDLINYTLTASNGGNQTLTDVTVNDNKVGTLTCNLTVPATLAPNTSVICTGSYAITQADIDAGLVNNTATADSGQTNPVNTPNTVSVPQAPNLSIIKEGAIAPGDDSVATPGDLINYTLTASNNGNQTLTGVTISDPKVTNLTCIPTTPTTLVPGASVVCTGSYAITQADIDAGMVDNIASAASDQTAPVNGPNTEDIVREPGLNIEKTGTLVVGIDNVATPGDLINYTINVSNNGNQTLTGVNVNDPKVTNLFCTPTLPTTLVPNAAVLCTGSYAISQSDIDAGVVNNTATADSDQTLPVNGPNVESVPQAPSLGLAKEGTLALGGDGIATPGDLINYTLIASNNGNQTLTNVTISDSKIANLICTPTTPATLAPSDSVACTGSYAITQLDIDVGIVHNSATADSNQTDAVEDTHQENLPQAPSLGLDKEGTLNVGTDSVATPGDLISYILTASNNGNQTLTAVMVSDPKIGTLTCTLPLPATLAPGDSVECSGSYVITQSDIDAGFVDNTATADSDQTPPTTAPHQENVPQFPILVINKAGTLALGVDNVATPGDLINYTLTAGNNGNQTLTNLMVSDDKVASLSCTPTIPSTLAPGETVICIGTYALTQADIDAGIVPNRAIADSMQTLPVDADHTEDVPQMPMLDLNKEGDLDVGGDGIATPGDLIHYTISAKNSGNQTLTGVMVSDPKLANFACDLVLPATLAPNASVICTGSYAITQADIDAGIVNNTATADSNQTLLTEAPNQEEVPQAPSLAIAKDGSLTVGSDTFATPGDLIDYTVTASNNGNQTLTGVMVNDSKLANFTCIPATPALLAPGDTIVCTGSYALTQADIDAGVVYNTATADSNQTDPVDALHTEDVPQAPSLAIAKEGTLDAGADNIATPGDLIHYTISANNNGNQTLTGVTVSDPKLTNFICTPTVPATLAPNAAVVCTGTYAITQGDIDTGIVHNTATADSEQTLPVDGSNQEDIVREPGLNMDKQGALDVGGDGIATPGDLINYTITALNSGNQTLTGVTVSDSKVATLTCIPTLPTTLAPGQSVVCTGSYALTQADIDAGTVDNIALGDSDQSDPKEGPHQQDVPQAPSLGLAKDGDLQVGVDGVATPGDLINYTITARNSGNQTLTGVMVSDPKVTNLTCTPVTPATLAPGASVICTGSYAITQGDIDAGVVNNTATADSNQTPAVEIPHQEDVPQAPSLGINKEGSLDVGTDGVATPGDLINYTITTSNSGNQTLTGVSVNDAKLGTLTCNPLTPATLAPNATIVCTGTYAITQVDIDTGFVLNQATAASNQTDPVDGSNQENVPNEPGLLVSKTPDSQQVVVGGVATFIIQVTNSGNTTLNQVTVTDLLSPSCNRDIGTMTVGQVVEYSCMATVSVDFTNRANANGVTPSGAPVQADDTAEVDAVKPDIEINKQASVDNVVWADSLAQVFTGSKVYYRFVVQNVGETPLAYTVTDPSLGQLLFGDPNHIFCSGTLAINQTVICGPFGPVSATYVNNNATANLATAQGCFQTSYCDTDTDTVTYSAFYWAFTPGFWKNHAPPKPSGGKNAWQYTGYKDPKALLWSVFAKPTCNPALKINGNPTLLEALGFGGGADTTGAAKNLLRTGVAALLNASFHETYTAANHPKAIIGPNGELLGPNGMVYYPYSSAKVIQLVNTALASCNRDTMLTLATQLDAYNNGIHLAPWNSTMSFAATLRRLYADPVLGTEGGLFIYLPLIER